MSDKNWLNDLKAAIKSPPMLRSIFTEVDIGQGHGKMDKAILYPRQLQADKSIVENVQQHGLLELLEAEEGHLNKLGLDEDETTQFFIAQKYGWRVKPVDTTASTGVSWFDHYKTQRALNVEDNPDGYILLKGDLTGIQGYIYGNIKQNTAGGLTKLAKRLRGRSAIVSLLTDFSANIVLRELGLPAWNLLFAGGGHFNVLLPDNAKTRERLKTIIPELDQEMLQMFGDKLQLVIAQVECKPDISTNAGYYFELLDTENSKQKYRPFQSNLAGHFYPEKKTIFNDELRKKKDERMEDFGRIFPAAKYLIEIQSTASIKSKTNVNKALGCKIGGTWYGLFTCIDLDDLDRLLLANNQNILSIQVYSLNSTDFIPTERKWEKPVSFGFRFIGKFVPTKPDEKKEGDRPKNFEEIAASDEDQIEMINALRLDVDDLGCIFSKGLGDAVSLASISALSREMHYFFSAYFDDLARAYEMYVIYSGGDDAFVVGKWNKTIDFVMQLQADFKMFTCNNPNMHFSAGIFMGKPHYPVGRFYRDAGRLQDEAKANSSYKEQVKIFNHALSCASFSDKISFGEQIVTMLKEGDSKNQRKFTMSFAFRLLQLVKTSFYDKDSRDDDGEILRQGGINTKQFARNSSSLRYLFARNGFSKKGIEKAEATIHKQLVTNFLRDFDVKGTYDKKQAVRDYLVALNYALFTIRSKKQTNSQHE
jgi:CRISPR-associated protein Csm1